MFYTLMKFLGWGILFTLVGGVVGWFLHVLQTRSQPAATSTVIDQQEIERMRQRLADLGGVVEERNRLRVQLAAGGVPASAVSGESLDTQQRESDVDVGMIRPELNDLTLIKGVGPEIAELCREVGIVTWQHLADAEQDDLVSMLDVAEIPYQFYDLRTWAQQADLLARGRWDEFNELIQLLDRRQ